MSLVEKIDAWRTAGNGHFAREAWKDAASSYTQAIDAYNSAKMGLPQQKSSASSSLSAISSAFSSVFSLSTQASSASASVPEKCPSAMDVNLHTLYSNRSVALLRLNRYQKALSDAEQVILIRPDWPKGYYRKAEALCAMERYDEAMSCFYRAMERYSSDEASAKLIGAQIELTAYRLQDQSKHFKIMQLLAGRDFAVSSWSPVNSIVFQAAKQLQNFVYCIACKETKKCVLIDACWDLDGILSSVKEAGFKVVAAIVTHYHVDHVGGKPPKPYDQYRVKIEGIVKLLKRLPKIRAYIHKDDIPGVLEGNSDLDMTAVIPTTDGNIITVGTSVKLECIHTPGHTPGSQCLLVNKTRLISGDTLFIGSVGRLDFPDSNARLMFESMQKLKALANAQNKNGQEILVYPGHNYGGAFTTLKKEIEHNPMMSGSYEQFKASTAGPSPSL